MDMLNFISEKSSQITEHNSEGVLTIFHMSAFGVVFYIAGKKKLSAFY